MEPMLKSVMREWGLLVGRENQGLFGAYSPKIFHANQAKKPSRSELGRRVSALAFAVLAVMARNCAVAQQDVFKFQ
ncbi:hypothetical protein VU08_03400 [Desulfobulbus sp. F5]|nr:hypothetical protein [Desulfobulbus sp. F5]